MYSADASAQYQFFVGVDIAATTATVAWQTSKQKPSKPITLEQTSEAFSSLHHRLLKAGVKPDETLVVMEAMRIYCLALATFLARVGPIISIVNPSQAHHFAKALLKPAKTDAIDAQTLTLLATLLQSAPWVPPPAVYEELEQRLTQRDSLRLMRGQIRRNQLHALHHNPVVVDQACQRMEALDQAITAQISEIEAELAALLPSAEEETSSAGMDSSAQAWAETITRLQTIPGIGLITAS